MEPVIPLEPWRLRGDFVVSLFLVPTAQLPESVRAHAPVGARLLAIGGRAIVGVAAVRYVPGGVLAYDELLVALPVTRGLRWGVTIPQIWVTSEASRDGGRSLWAIPKELMTVARRISGATWNAAYRAAPRPELAAVDARASTRLPGRWTLLLPTVQRLVGVEVASRNTVRGVLAPARASWRFSGSLAWLQGRRPVLSIAIARADVVFGGRVRRSSAPPR